MFWSVIFKVLSFLLLCPFSIVLLSPFIWSLKKWEAHIETVVIPTPFSPDSDVNTLKLKLKVCT